MELSQRITNITGGGSDGWDVFYKARRMIAEGTDVIELTIGEHDIRTDPIILSAMDTSARGGHTGYAMVPGTQELREAVATRLTERTGVPTTYENILITPGGQSALFAAHLATCSPGTRALFIDPYYATYPGTIRSVGAEPVAIATHAENAFKPRAEDITSEAIKGASSLLINTPNNPTGTIYERDTLQAIAQVCQEQDLWLISDEVYDTQVWEGAHLSPRALPGMAERTLVIGSMSKSHAMTGSRIGWIAAPKEVITHLINLATHTTYGVPGYIQDAAVFALSQGNPLEEEVAAPFRRRRKLASDILAAQSTVGLIPAQGAMYIMLNVRATGLSGEEFANSLLDTHHIATMPGESFGTSAHGHIRVAMTVDDERFKQALQILVDHAEILASHKAS
ncbi:aminotransferase class I/II-fold pyridoxal phosphate-dependent enzyme [Shimia sp. R11_0]|uniref:pyridoxal phosphate-dependent aminotransferase n=1 Tax=Shimia sp. R11_0 TaxID=2821096 RepID=UPI001AD9F069|nr:aminotransferase class I/II-fold pyridoxal phosphate-dependent enzyme [Shimia sp. R11_0]MBO9479249.1 aminotransferase class I/II-fold pyridoxal phosphate-dependent enzyme [Shimia sp. R11_0]